MTTTRLLSTVGLLAYCFLLIKVMVLKEIPTFTFDHATMKFGGTTSGGPPNFVPFRMISFYLSSDRGWLIPTLNLGGNIALLVPVGLLLPFVLQAITWRTALVAGIAFGLAIEITQAVFDIGQFDIDDVILNALGVMVGYWALLLLTTLFRGKRRRARR